MDAAGLSTFLWSGTPSILECPARRKRKNGVLKRFQTGLDSCWSESRERALRQIKLLIGLQKLDDVSRRLHCRRATVIASAAITDCQSRSHPVR